MEPTIKEIQTKLTNIATNNTINAIAKVASGVNELFNQHIILNPDLTHTELKKIFARSCR